MILCLHWDLSCPLSSSLAFLGRASSGCRSCRSSSARGAVGTPEVTVARVVHQLCDHTGPESFRAAGFHSKATGEFLICKMFCVPQGKRKRIPSNVTETNPISSGKSNRVFLLTTGLENIGLSHSRHSIDGNLLE